MDNEKRKEEILMSYRTYVENTKNALRLLDFPESSILTNTINLPDFDKLIPEDVVKFYRDIRKLVVFHLNRNSMSAKEISRRMGGASYSTVWKMLKERKKHIGTKEVSENNTI